jgi:hypothetical protein
MQAKVGYSIASVTAAVAGAWIIFTVWDTLIRHDIALAPTSLSWFPLVAALWGFLCLAVGGLLYRRGK